MQPRCIQRFISILQSAHKHWNYSTLPRRSIHAVYYDLVLQDEIETVWKLEKQGAVDSISVLTRLNFPNFPVNTPYIQPRTSIWRQFSFVLYSLTYSLNHEHTLPCRKLAILMHLPRRVKSSPAVRK